MDLGIEDKAALVLGGSNGLGLGVARALLAEGARVTISSRSTENLDAARDSLPKDLQDRCHVVAADLSDLGAPEAIVSGALAATGQVDILVNNGGGPPTGMPSAIDVEGLSAQFETMVRPLVAITLRLLPAMRERGFGRILTIASSGVIQPIPHLPVSNSLRSALVGFSKTLAGEVAGDGVTVNVIAPGRIETDRTRSIDEAVARRTGRPVEDVAGDSAGTIPAGRYGTIDEFGAVAAFLAGIQASYITGSILRVDGGAIRSI